MAAAASATTATEKATTTNNNDDNDEHVPFLFPTSQKQNSSKNDDKYKPLSIDGDGANECNDDLYDSICLFDDDDDDQHHNHSDHVLQNFTRMCILFSMNHGSVVACLALATSQLGSIGAWQTGILYASYTLSALFGATYVVKRLGSRDSLALGMGLYCAYVGCFVIAITRISSSSSSSSISSNNNNNCSEDIIIDDDDDDDNINDDDPSNHKLVAYTGAFIGGIGAGLIWTAQGTYFSQASKEYSKITMIKTSTSTSASSSSSNSTSLLAGIFAFWYLIGEVGSRLIASFLLELNLAKWREIFGLYTIMSILSTIGMKFFVYKYPVVAAEVVVLPVIISSSSSSSSVDLENDDDTDGDDDDDDTSHYHGQFRRRRNYNSNNTTTTTLFYKITAAIQLLLKDPKMKYMIGLNAVFGFSSAFITTYVNGEVLPIVLNDPQSKYVGIYTSWSSAVAATMSLVFGGTTTGSFSCDSSFKQQQQQQTSSSPSSVDENNKATTTATTTNNHGNNHNNNNSINRKGRILILGSLCFMGVVLPFMLVPDVSNQSYWSWKLLVFVYGFQGIGRATFEGTLKATFADFFGHYESEGAFANIIVQSGLSSAIGSILAFNLPCHNPSGQYCIEYRDGSYQRILWLELIIGFLAIFAIFGYLRAARLHEKETASSCRRHHIFDQTKD